MKTIILKNNLIILWMLLAALMLTAVSAVADTPGEIRYEREGESSSEVLESFPPSIFPHWVHRIHYRCDVCHDDLFVMKRGGTPVTMDLIEKGKVCGACHNGTLAFAASLNNCYKCHVPLEE